MSGAGELAAAVGAAPSWRPSGARHLTLCVGGCGAATVNESGRCATCTQLLLERASAATVTALQRIRAGRTPGTPSASAQRGAR